MSKKLRVAVGLIFMGMSTTSLATSMDDMLGTWTWEGYTVKVEKCESTGVCATVMSGPRNVGMEMIRTRPMPKDDAFVGQIVHPMTGQVYNSRMFMADSNTWHIDGCTDAGACASGDFTRVAK